MKKISTGADLGGGPFTKADLRVIFNQEIWSSLEGLMSIYDSHVEGVIVSGCVFTNNAGNFDMTAGVVYLNQQFMRIPAFTNQPYTKYIAPLAPINDIRNYGDGGSHVLAVDYQATLVGSAPGSGQYITINSLTGAEDRRLGRANSAWVNFSSFGTDWAAGSPAAQYMIDIFGMVHFRGWIKTTTGGATSNFTVVSAGVLPKPLSGDETNFPKFYTLHGGGAYRTSPCFIAVEDDGSMQAYIPNGTVTPTAIDAAICLDGISYMLG